MRNKRLEDMHEERVIEEVRYQTKVYALNHFNDATQLLSVSTVSHNLVTECALYERTRHRRASSVHSH